MRTLLVSDKKGLSNIISYVILIAITISLSVMVYGWLKFYVSGEDIEECPDGVNLVVSGYECASNSLNVTLKNKGLFTVDGYVLRVHDRPDAEIGFYVFDDLGDSIVPSVEHVFRGDFTDVAGTILNDITLIEVQPFMMIDGERVSCKVFSTQEVSC